MNEDQDITSQVRLLSLAEKKFLVLFVLGLAAFWNYRFADQCARAMILKMNDVPFILTGYQQTPRLFPDSLRWWHGTWIEDGIHVFRPLSSYLLWIETWIGLRWGFVWVGCIGYVLFVTDCLIAVALSWRLTENRACVFLSAFLAPALRMYNWGGIQPEYWLAWYPVHHDLLMIGFMMGALLCFLLWLQTGQRTYLGTTWTLFLMGVLSKEYVYIFPLLALTLLWGTRSYAVRSRIAFGQICLMVAAVLALFAFRCHVLVHPYNPSPISAFQVLKMVVLYWCAPALLYIATGMFWVPGLAILLFFLAGGSLRLQRDKTSQWLKNRYAWPLIWLTIVGIVAVYCSLTFGLAESFWFFIEGNPGAGRRMDLIMLIGEVYIYYVLWKYRKQAPTLPTWALMAFTYLPVLAYQGWHYTITGWFILSATYWPLVLKLVLWEVRLPLQKASSRVPFSGRALHSREAS